MTNSHTHRGRVYRRCACRCAGKQLGAHCPELTSSARHGTWTFAVDMPSLTGKRATMRRGDYPTRKVATAALARVLECERAGIRLDDRQTVADYLATWLTEKSRTLADVHLDEAVLFVRYTLSNIRNTTPVMTSPKTKSSHAWVGLSTRVVSAFERQVRRQAALGVTSDLVFSRPNGAPLRPESVLHHFHRLCAAAGVPRVRVHDLRHLAATLMISSQVPLATASKTLRHSKLSITVDTYGHLVPYAGQQAVDAIADALADAELCRSDA